MCCVLCVYVLYVVPVLCAGELSRMLPSEMALLAHGWPRKVADNPEGAAAAAAAGGGGGSGAGAATEAAAAAAVAAARLPEGLVKVFADALSPSFTPLTQDMGYTAEVRPSGPIRQTCPCICRTGVDVWDCLSCGFVG